MKLVTNRSIFNFIDPEEQIVTKISVNKDAIMRKY